MFRTSSILGAAVALSIVGCEPPESVSCGPGTVLQGDQCVAEMAMMMPPSGGADAGPEGMGPPPAPPPSGGTDAGPGWSTTPPMMGGPPAPGCDTAMGVPCDRWEAELTALLATHEGRGCDAALARPEPLQAIAERHAAHQAGIDMLDSTSPDGDLFQQMRDSGVYFMYAGALFSVGNRGAEDVLARWLMSDGSREVLGQCWTIAGVAFATSEAGWSYVTVLLGR